MPHGYQRPHFMLGNRRPVTQAAFLQQAGSLLQIALVITQGVGRKASLTADVSGERLDGPGKRRR